MKLRNAYFSLIVTVLFSGMFFSAVKAEEKEVEYNSQSIVDSDLDGLTDQAEIQKYGTDYRNADTDADGFMDGIEVVNGTSPLDSNDPNFSPVVSKQETPWAWYIGRAAGIIAFAFLWLTVFLGLSIRNPLLRRIIEPLYSFDFHCFMAALAVFWVLVHGTSFLWDKMTGFGIRDVTIPFFAQSEFLSTNYLALGIMAFYAMAIMTATSYLRRYIRHWLWRLLHFLNPIAFAFVVVHGYYIGTDMKNAYIGGAYLLSSSLLVLIYFSSLVFVIINKIRQS